ncbi:MAG: peptidoglycan DD-metalloendopeptidase family protein [Myxococcales bacterium]|nr:peptidoglycan DD-metalloendopeptidase family protein [Myxococcales bacterium]MCB9626768.1 peptidoglycan DD-metalloendopeptidase family protein [Sandaracinaceae bacterium]
MTRRLRLLLLCCLVVAAPALAQPGFAPLALGASPRSLVEVDEAIATQDLLVRTEEARRARLAAELDALGSARADFEERIIRQGRALYRIRRTGLLPVAGGFEAMLGHLSRVERLERLVQREIENVRTTRDRQIALQHDIARLDRSVEDARQQLARLNGDRARIQEQQQLAMLYEQTFMAPSLPLSPVMPGMGTGLQMSDGSALGPTFATMRGRLGIPTEGRYRTTDVQREDGPAVEFRTEGEAPARVVADGRVAFVGRYGNYGLMVIVEHGESFFTVYAGLSSADVQVGSALRMGQRVGRVLGSPLLFQVRRGTRALDARSWLGL